MTVARNPFGLIVCGAVSMLLPCWDACTAERTQFFSPVEMAEIRKLSIASIRNRIDWTEISFNVSVPGYFDRVVEYRSEDSSAYRLVRRGKEFLYLQDMPPYWGYRADHEVQMFFVDDDVNVGGAENESLPYTYEMVVLGKVTASRYSCVFRHMEALAEVNDRARVSSKFEYNRIAYKISAYLSIKGADPKREGCKKRKM